MLLGGVGRECALHARMQFYSQNWSLPMCHLLIGLASTHDLFHNQSLPVCGAILADKASTHDLCYHVIVSEVVQCQVTFG
jgi:hypothetical protein